MDMLTQGGAALAVVIRVSGGAAGCLLLRLDVYYSRLTESVVKPQITSN